MESSKLINCLTNKCQSDQANMVMEHAHKYEKRGLLFMSTLFVVVIFGLKLPIYRWVWKNIYFLN
jgi:hypothetical protein